MVCLVGREPSEILNLRRRWELIWDRIRLLASFGPSVPNNLKASPWSNSLHWGRLLYGLYLECRLGDSGFCMVKRCVFLFLSFRDLFCRQRVVSSVICSPLCLYVLVIQLLCFYQKKKKKDYLYLYVYNYSLASSLLTRPSRVVGDIERETFLNNL